MSGPAETERVRNASDIVAGGPLFRILPPGARPYLTLARVDRPIGTWLLLLPCWWGLALAAGPAQLDPLLALWYAALFAVGAFVMRGAGCTWNDIVDRDYDSRVARTAGRPIASGTIPVRAAVIFMVAQALVGLTVLLQFNAFTIGLATASLGLVVLYPLMKRFTYWPQAWLGLTFNWGALVGWAAVTGGLDLPAVLLYLAGICWTLGYDTIYAHQDKEDDALIGVRSTALLFGAQTKRWLAVFYGATVGLLVAAGHAANLGILYHVCIAAGAAQLAWQVAALSQDDPADCLVKFRSNRWFGLTVVGAIVISQPW